MRKSKEGKVVLSTMGFTLIELLAVIIILAVIALIATSIVLNVVDNARKNANKDSAYGLLDSSKLYYMESLLDESKSLSGNLIDKINVSGRKPDSGTVYINNKGETALAVVYDKVCYIKNYTDTDLTEVKDIENCNISSLPSESKELYKDSILNGADPELKDNLVPVVIENDGTVKKADISKEWYNYINKTWANAVILKDKTINYQINQIIPESNIDGYFVWIPKYSYKIFNLGNYTSVITVDSKPSESAAQEIEIKFGTSNTKDEIDGECTTPMLSGESGNCIVGDYMTHPAFISMDTTGLWVAKFETTGTIDAISVLPNQVSLRDINVNTMFGLAYNYDRSLDSHMMKNTEWGAVAYLSHSKYGINSEIRINNSSTYITGCAASVENGSAYAGCENEYYKSIGYLASTTGNISGIYDMSGGAMEYMASYKGLGSSGFTSSTISNYDSKYFDVYPTSSARTSYNKRILGDATGELGPFYYYKGSDNQNRYHSTWGADIAIFSDGAFDDWHLRGGGAYSSDTLAGSFAFTSLTGGSYNTVSFRLVLR